MPKLSINLVTWNGAQYLVHLFSSLKNQTFKDWELVVIDNASTDITPELVPWTAKISNLPLKYIANKENLGFAKAHNQAIKENHDEYVLVLNQDIYLQPDCLEKIVYILDAKSDVASVAPRLMRWNLPTPPEVEPLEPTPLYIETTFTDTIDSLGLKVLRSRRVVEFGMGKKWHEAATTTDPSTSTSVSKVFGVSGACALYRRKAMEEIMLDGNFFDESYGSYKEDVDVTFRLQSAGWTSYVALDAVAYHDRTAHSSDANGTPVFWDDLSQAFNKQKQAAAIRLYSERNHLYTLFKNEYWQNFILDFPWIVWYELKKFVYFLLFDRAVLAGLGDIWRERKELKMKRLRTTKLRKVSWRELRKWFV